MRIDKIIIIEIPDTRKEVEDEVESQIITFDGNKETWDSNLELDQYHTGLMNLIYGYIAKHRERR